MIEPTPITWSKLPVSGGTFPKLELKVDRKAIRENLRKQREQRGVKITKSKLP